MRTCFFRAIYLAGVASAAITLPLSSPALAQAPAQQPAPAAKEDADADAPSADNIVVTARRVEERLQDVPLAVSAFNTEELEKRVIATHQDLNKLDPALAVQTSPPRGSFYPNMRGQSSGAGGAGNASVPSGVVPYFAEAPNIYPAFFDLANIQVIKGPQGTLFGETATGGVILFEPKRPGGQFEGYVDAQIGNRGHAFGEAAVTIPIISDLWSVRIAGQIQKRNGFTKILNSRPGITSASWADNTDRRSYRISSSFKPLPGLEIYTMYMKDVQESNGTSGILHAVYDATAFMSIRTPASAPASAAAFLYYTGYEAPAGKTLAALQLDRLALQRQLGPRAYTVNYDTRSKREYWALVNQVTWNISDNVTFKDITSLSQSSARGSSIQIDASDVAILDSMGQICKSGVSPDDCMDRGAKPFSNEARLNGTLFDDRLNWQGGFYYRKVPDVITGPSGSVIVAAAPSGIPLSPTASINCTSYGVAPGTVCTQLSSSFVESYAGYGQVNFRVIDGVHLTAGFRRSWDYVRSSTYAGAHYTIAFQGQTIAQSVLGTPQLPGTTRLSVEVPRTHTDTYTLGADWKVTDDFLLFINHRKGHKIGGVNTGVPADHPLRIYGPETVKDFELGAKGSFKTGGLRVNTALTLFQTNFTNIQKRTSTTAPNSTALLILVDNVAAAKIKGVELSLNVDAGSYFNLGVQYAYLDARFTDWVDSTTCSSDASPTGCQQLFAQGVPGLLKLSTTQVVVDHVNGTKTANGVTDRFKHDLFNSAPKHRIILSPTLKLGFLSERMAGASLSANISYVTRMASGDINRSALIPEQDALVPSHWNTDLRFDWRNFTSVGGVKIDLFASATNLFNTTSVVSRNTFTNLCGCVNDQYNEPRVIFTGFKARF